MNQLLVIGAIAVIVSAVVFFAMPRRGPGYLFTEDVRRALASAREEAAELGHEYVGTEHILLGVLDVNAGIPSVVLSNLSIDPTALRNTVLTIVKGGNTYAPTGPDLPYTSRGKRVLQESVAEARELGHNYVGMEHLFLGLLREPGIASQILQEAGATVESVRRETIALLPG